MSSAVAERASLGAQAPRILHLPESASSAGEEAIDLARMAGLVLDPWQETVLAGSLGVRVDGKWAAFEIGLTVSRQNGKGALLEARELAGLFLLGERLIIHSAHLFDTSLEHFDRLLGRIEDTPELLKRVASVSRSHGKEGIKLKNGQQIRFRARTSGGGRGFTADLVILDEAMDIPESVLGALLPTVSARPNPQVWYTGSAVDQEVHENGVVFARVRERGRKGDDPRLAYFEWSRSEEKPHEVLAPMDGWADANPGLGIRISSEHVANEQRSMDPRTFAVERLGVGDWPRTDGLAGVPITPEAWAACIDANATPRDPVVFAFDVPPDRSTVSIAVAGWREQGHAHVEVLPKRPGTGWLPARMAELVEKHKPAAVICDASGPVATLLPEVEKLGVQVTPLNGREHAQACGLIFDMVEQKTLTHLDDPDLAAAIQGSEKRPLGDAWAWSRKNSAGEISPLVAVTLALWGIQTVQIGEAKVIDMTEIEADMRAKGEL
jgi:hypothetical protein